MARGTPLDLDKSVNSLLYHINQYSCFKILLNYQLLYDIILILVHS